MLSTILNFVENHLSLLCSLLSAVIFLIVNIILAIRHKSLGKLKEALTSVPEIIRLVEQLGSVRKLSSIEKKASAESILYTRYGEKFIKKYIAQFDAAIEDVLNTPAKKGDFRDGISKENEER